MTSNHEEYSNGITLENLKYSVQIYWGCTYLCRKSNEVAFSNFLYNSFQLPFMFCRTLFMHWKFCLHMLPSAVCNPATGKKGLSFLLWLLLISD